VVSSKGKWVGAIFGLSIAAIIFIIPFYLTYSDAPQRAEAAVVLVCPGFEARMKEAKELARKGLIKRILIPAYSEVIGPSDSHVHIGYKPSMGGDPYNPTAKISKSHLSDQNTYRELVRAREMIDGYGFRSAVIVSSPYHMRRVKIMCSEVFPSEDYDILCIGTKYEHTHRAFWFFYSYDRKWVLTECGKLAWFLID